MSKMRRLARLCGASTLLAAATLTVTPGPAEATACSVSGWINVQNFLTAVYNVHSLVDGSSGCLGYQVTVTAVPAVGTPTECTVDTSTSTDLRRDCTAYGIALANTSVRLSWTIVGSGSAGEVLNRSGSCTTIIRPTPNFGGCSI